MPWARRSGGGCGSTSRVRETHHEVFKEVTVRRLVLCTHRTPLLGEDMRFDSSSVLQLALLLVVLLFSGCYRHQRSWDDALGTKIAKNNRESEAFKKRLAEWLCRYGFTAATDLGGMTSWSGLHRDGEINSWYRGSFHDSPSILLCVRIFPRKDVGGGFTEFHLTQVWDVTGSSRYVAEMEARSKEFKTEFARAVFREKDDEREP